MDQDLPSLVGEFLAAFFATGIPTYLFVLALGFAGGYGLANWQRQKRRKSRRDLHRSRDHARDKGHNHAHSGD
jgi:hypothetical protein